MKVRVYYGNQNHEAEIEAEYTPMPENRFKMLIRLLYYIIGITACIAVIWIIGKDALFPILVIVFFGLIAAFVRLLADKA